MDLRQFQLRRRLRRVRDNLIRLANAPYRQRTVAVSEITNIFACGYGPNGWHPIVETLREYQANPGINWRATTLFRYHKAFTPASISDLISPELARECHLPIFFYPWGSFNRHNRLRDPRLSRFCGPSSDDFIRNEYQSCISIFEKIEENGYKPWRCGNGFLQGTFLFNNNGERRFVVMNGNHRVAALAVLGVEKVAVRIEPGLLLTEVRESEASLWPRVRDGSCSEAAAKVIFNLFFREVGTHVQQLVESRVPTNDLSSPRDSAEIDTIGSRLNI